MRTFHYALATVGVGLLCVATSFLWPAIPDPRANWTEQKAIQYSDTGQEIHSLSHALSDEMQHATGDPNHAHAPGESNDPRLTALELERARDRSATLHAELESARQNPAGWHLLLGLVGVALVIVGGVVAAASRWHS